MNIPTRTFTDIIRDMCAAVTASASNLIDISVGSVLRAIIEANAAIVLWVQWLVLLTLQTTRAATSTGADLDSWMADFSFSRLPAAVASGMVTFSRYSGSIEAFVPAGTVVKTQDGSISFTVAAESTNSAWQQASNSYSLPAGVMSIDLPVVATSAGLSGNVLAETITLLASAVPGIDYVNNSTETSGGQDSESDPAFRTRFANFFAARPRATPDAIAYAISLVGPDINYVVLDNVDSLGNPQLGNMLIIVDDGSDTLPNALLSSLAFAVNSVRAIGTSFSIQPAQVVPVQVSLSIVCSAETVLSTAQNALQSEIQDYISSRPIGGMVSISRISQIVYQTEPKIINVSNIILNNQSTDLVAPPRSSFRPQSVSFT